MLKLKDLIGVINAAVIEDENYDDEIKRLADLPENMLEREVECIDDSGLDELYLIIRLKSNM